MTSRSMLLAGAVALVFTAAAAEPPHGKPCPPGQRCDYGQQGGQAFHPGPANGQRPATGPGAMTGPGPKFGAGPVFKGGPGWNKGPADWHWQDDRGGWHRDHDRYWRPEFRGGFVPTDRLFFALRQHQYNRIDGEPYWFRGRFVVKSFDRWGRPVLIELNPYTGDFIGVVRF